MRILVPCCHDSFTILEIGPNTSQVTSSEKVPPDSEQARHYSPKTGLCSKQWLCKQMLHSIGVQESLVDHYTVRINRQECLLIRKNAGFPRCLFIVFHARLAALSLEICHNLCLYHSSQLFMGWKIFSNCLFFVVLNISFKYFMILFL